MLDIAVAQLNLTVGDLDGNVRQMTTAEREHRVGASSSATAAWAGAQHAASHCSEPEAALVPGQCTCAWALLTPRTVTGGCS